jgi:hypothetical protein
MQWDFLSISGKILFLTYLSESAEDINSISELVISTLKSMQELDPLERDARLNDFVGILNFLPNIAEKRGFLPRLSLDPDLLNFIERLVFEMGLNGWIGEHVLLQAAARTSDLLVGDFAYHQDFFEPELNELIANYDFFQYRSGLNVASELMRTLSGYFTDNQLTALDTRMQQIFLSDQPSDQDYRFAFTNYLDGPVRSEVIKIFADFLVAEGTLEALPLEAFPLLSDSLFLKLPDLAADQFFQRASIALSSRFYERVGGDEYSHAVDRLTYNLVHLANRSPRATIYRDELIGVLRAYNPPQLTEMDTDYQARIEAISAVWRNQGIFIADLSGGISEYPDLVRVVSQYGESHPGWVEMVVFATTEGAEAHVGVAQFNWHFYNQPQILMESLLHEGAHSVQLRDKRTSPLLDRVPEYWFRETSQSSSQTAVSDYARANPDEFFAEVVRFWQIDTRSALRIGLNNVRSGDEAMLNMFLFCWGLPGPSDSPLGRTRPLFYLTDNGSLDVELIQAGWARGGIRDGIFEFEFESHNYAVTYADYIIQTVKIDSDILYQRPQKPALVATPRFRIADQNVWVLSNLVAHVGLSGKAPELKLLVAPAGVILDAATASLSWIPTKEQVGKYTILLRATDPQDSHFKDYLSIAVDVTHNSPPRFQSNNEFAVVKGQELVVRILADDPDRPSNEIFFSFEKQEQGATIDSSTGLFKWYPNSETLPGRYDFTVLAIDNGLPPAASKQVISVTVLPAPEIHLNIAKNGSKLRLEIMGSSGRPFEIQSSPDLIEWSRFQQFSSGDLIMDLPNFVAAEESRQYFRAILL